MKGQFEEIAVKEAKVFLKTVSEGLKTLAKGIESLAKQVDGLSDPDMKKGAAPKAAATQKTKSQAKKKAKADPTKPPEPKRKTSETASDVVLRLINRSRKGISASELSEKAGFDRKKVQNIVYRLKKNGKIKLIRKGVYGKA